jgi:hypothetical protein
MSWCSLCWRTYQPTHYSSECLDCRDLSIEARIAWRLLDEALEAPPFQVWPKRRHRRRRLPVQQPAEVALGAQCRLQPLRKWRWFRRHWFLQRISAPQCKILVLRRWLFVGDLDDVRKVAGGTGPKKVTHILCLCPEYVKDTSSDRYMKSMPQALARRNTFCTHLVRQWYGRSST